MKTYIIEINTYTKKGHKETHHTFAICSESTLSQLTKAYTDKYQGFTINIVEIPVVKAIEIEDITKVEIITESNIIFKEANYNGYNGTPDRYLAKILNKDIVGYSSFKEKFDRIEKEKTKLNDEFIEHVKTKFSLNEIDELERKYDCVTFYFYPTSFKFNK